jgi:hypothetical protein
VQRGPSQLGFLVLEQPPDLRQRGGGHRSETREHGEARARDEIVATDELAPQVRQERRGVRRHPVERDDRAPALLRRAVRKHFADLGKGEHAVPAYRYRGFSGDRLVVIVQ